MVCEKLTNQERKKDNMNHTVLSANHMVGISLEDPGGGEMIKVRLQGKKEDLEWISVG